MAQRNLSFLQNITDDDKVLLDRVLDRAEMAEEKYITKYSFFLDERQQGLCRQALASVKFENYRLWGGFEEAERRVLCTYPEYDVPSNDDFPIRAVTFAYRQADKLGHRDFLGSLMGLGITRSSVGDILVGEGKAAVFVKDTVAGDVLSITKVGRVGVKASQGLDSTLVVRREFKEITGTVASLRFDCVVALAVRQSREKAAAAIKAGLAEIGHVKVLRPDKEVCVGDVFSVRGQGKFMLKSVDGKSAKDRSHITICKYI